MYVTPKDDLITSFLCSDEVEQEIARKIRNGEPIEEYRQTTLYRVFVDESPYFSAIPLWLAVKAFHITRPQIGLLYSLYSENNIYKAKGATSESLIAPTEKERNIFCFQGFSGLATEHQVESPVEWAMLQSKTRRVLSEILKSHIKKADLYLFMAAAGVQQVQGVPGYPLGFKPGGEETNPPAPEQATPAHIETVTSKIENDYRQAAEGETKGRKKALLAVLYAGMGLNNREIAGKQELGGSTFSKIAGLISTGERLAEEKTLPSLQKGYTQERLKARRKK